MYQWTEKNSASKTVQSNICVATNFHISCFSDNNQWPWALLFITIHTNIYNCCLHIPCSWIKWTAWNICLKYLSATDSVIVLVFSRTFVIGPLEQNSSIIAFFLDLVSNSETKCQSIQCTGTCILFILGKIKGSSIFWELSFQCVWEDNSHATQNFSDLFFMPKAEMWMIFIDNESYCVWSWCLI